MAESYDGHGGDSPQWWPSRYGADDELGSGNELTPDRTMAALQIPQEGRTIGLAQTLFEGAAAIAPRTWKQLVAAHGVLEERLMAREEGGDDLSYFEEHVLTSYHIGCHLDALAHVGIKDRFYNGNRYSDIYEPTGLKKLGIENVRPWIARGVCLNICAVAETDQLTEGFAISVDHLEEAQKEQGVEIRAGDVVLLHTGWGELWSTDVQRYEALEPGCSWDAAHYLTDKHVSLVGADNWGFEVLPFEREDGPFAVHQHLLAETGTHIVENLTTTELVSSGSSEFLFILTVPKTQGSTAAIASPVAVI